MIVLLAAGSVSAAGFLQADSLINTIEKEGRAPIEIPEIDRAQAGEAQTLMILGSDQRYGDKKLGSSRPPRPSSSSASTRQGGASYLAPFTELFNFPE